MKKVLIIILSLVLLSVLGVFLYFKLRFKLEVTLTSTLDIPFGVKVNLKNFIKESNATFKDFETSFYELGTTEVKLTYIDKYNREKDYSFNVNVVDVGSPLILASESKSTYVGEEINLLKNVICADWESNNVTCEVEGEYDINELGTYNLKYKATDISGNTTYKDFKLYVNKKPGYTPYYPPEIYLTPFETYLEEYKDANTSIGIDISRFQGDIDFKKVRDAGCEFVIIRLGWDVDGELGLDYNYEKYIKDAYEAGLDIGLYFYSEAKNIEDIKKEVEFIKENIHYDIKLPIAYDWEDFNNYNSYNVSLFEFNKMAELFISLLNEAGYDSILYGSKYYLTNIWRFQNTPVWVAQYYDTVTYDGSYKMWQITDSASIDGIKSGVDVDILYLN